MEKYDDWKLANGLEDKEDIHTRCDHCLNEISKDCEYYKTDIGEFCDSVCFMEYCKDYHNGSYEVAE